VSSEGSNRDEVNRRAASRRAFWWLVVVVLTLVGTIWELLLFGVLRHPPPVLVFLPFVVALVPVGGIVQSIRTQVRGYNETPDPKGWAPWWVWVNRHPFLVVGTATVVVMTVIGLFVFRS
jgi:hypothetical protein